MNNQDIENNIYVISPIPPQKNGIADYAYNLFKDSNVTFVVDGIERRNIARKILNINNIITIYEFEEKIVDCKQRLKLIYNIGNNADHDYIIPMLKKHAGVVIVHDINMHYCLEKYSELSISAINFSQSMIYKNYGSEWTKNTEKNKKLSEFSNFKKSKNNLFLSIIPDGTEIIVHSNYAKLKIKNYLPLSNVHLIPHFELTNTIEKIDEVECKKLIIGSFGFYSRSKNFEVIAQLVLELQKKINVTWIICGDIENSIMEINKIINYYNIENYVEVITYADEMKLNKIISKCHFNINLRNPTHGENSGIMARCIPLGVPTISYNNGSYAELPDSICIKFEIDDSIEQISKKILEIFNEKNMLTLKKACIKYSKDNLDKNIILANINKIIDSTIELNGGYQNKCSEITINKNGEMDKVYNKDEIDLFGIVAMNIKSTYFKTNFEKILMQIEYYTGDLYIKCDSIKVRLYLDECLRMSNWRISELIMEKTKIKKFKFDKFIPYERFYD
jgi:hypothetical protein